MDQAQYQRRGHLGPLPLLGREEARRLIGDIVEPARQVPGLIDRPTGRRYWSGLGTTYAWYKSLHVHVPAAYQVATLPALTGLLSALVGPRLLLWGCELIRKGGGEAHRWHSDVECESHGVTVWLALDNAGAGSGLKLLDGSHQFGASPQELAPARRVDLLDDAAVLGLARGLDPAARITVPAVTPGELVLFPGRLWHASFNVTAETRTVLVLQYSAAGSVVRIPHKIGPPLRWHPAAPPTLEVRGR
jgi:ectoine hydroxylase-related dioxygenase (phytanoyl-CoA dioxygenase family)